MGYTHYWDRPCSFNLESFRLLVQDAQRIIGQADQQLGIQICSWDGTGRPELDDARIVLNGHEDGQAAALVIERVFDPADALEQVSPTLWRDRCKTERQPYDIVVMAILIALAYHVDDVTLFSDGNSEDWAPGVELYERATGRMLTCRPWQTPPLV